MSQSHTPQATSSLSMWLNYLENIHTSAIDLGLSRVQVVAQGAHLTKPAPLIITVAGTNGKGSTCAIIEAILLDAGYRVGVYSSPHLISYNERVRINGEVLADQLHCHAFAFIESERQQTSLSFFEFGTLAALKLFQDAKVDVLLLEVGLGGRLDATNVVEHDISVITSLAVDHVDWLGDDIEVIAQEKAGIFRAGKPAICGQPDAPITVAAYADEIGAELHQIGYQYQYQVQGDRWDWQSGPFDLTDLPIPQLPLPNAATAIMALGLAHLDISDVNIVNGLENAALAGRMQCIQQAPTVILDVAHNPHSAAYLTQQLQQQYPDKLVHCVLGMLHDKDIPATIEQLAAVVSYWYPCSLAGPRGASATELRRFLPTDKCQSLPADATPSLAYQAALEAANQEALVIVVGSFHTVAEVLAAANIDTDSDAAENHNSKGGSGGK